jgi:hypothetical protein
MSVCAFVPLPLTLLRDLLTTGDKLLIAGSAAVLVASQIEEEDRVTAPVALWPQRDSHPS